MNVDKEFEEKYNFDKELKEFELETLSATSNLLDYWKKHSEKWPILAGLARLVLTPQATSCASEAVFSQAGLVLRNRRTRLLPSNFNMVIFLAYAFKQLEYCPTAEFYQ